MGQQVTNGSDSHAVQLARLETTSEDHERRITQIEGLAWKVLVAALAGASLVDILKALT